EVALDLARREPPAVEEQDVLVEVGEPPEVLRDELRLERRRPVTGHRDVERAAGGEEPALRPPVPGVLPPGVGLGAEVVVELRLRHALHESGGEGGEEAVGPEEGLRVVGGGEELVEELRSDVHGGQGLWEGPSETASYTRFLTVPKRTPRFRCHIRSAPDHRPAAPHE